MGSFWRSQVVTLCVLLLVQGASAQDGKSGSNPDADFGIGDTEVGDKNDLGTADPLNGLEENKNPSANTTTPSDGKGMPEFKDVAPSGQAEPPSGEKAADKAGEKPSGPTNAESAAPAAPAASAPPAPPPAVAEPEPPAAAPAEPAPAHEAPRSKRSRHAEAGEDAGSREADSPDFRRERNFHSIYEKFNVNPTPLDAWEQAVSQRQSQSYKVQKGDTLWDLSKTFFGDAHYWPKVWALNDDQVTNPHEIDTWMQIRFFPGDLNEPPTLAVTETPAAAEAADVSDKQQPSAAADAPAPETAKVRIPPAKNRAGVLRKLPPTFPIAVNVVVQKKKLDFSGVHPPAGHARPDATLTYYVSDTPPRGEGLVKETEAGSSTAAEFQYIFVSGAQAGKVYTVMKDMGSLKDPRRPDAPPAHLVEVQGEIEVLEPANGVGLSRAIVRRNLAQVEVGSMLVPGTVQTVSTLDGPASNGPSLRIIGSEFNNNRKMVDAEGFVFLNGGTATGISEGQILTIHADPLVRNADSQVRVSTRVIGHVRIVKASEHFATGFITQVIDEIAIGDLVGSPEVASASPVSSEPAIEEMPGGETPAASSGDDLSLDDEMSAPSPAKSAPAENSSGGKDDDFNLDL